MTYTDLQRRPELQQCRREFRARRRPAPPDAGARLPDDLSGRRAGLLQCPAIPWRHQSSRHDLIEALRARVDDLKERVQLGRSRPAELLQAQTDLANAKRDRGIADAARSTPRSETLAFYIGVPPDRFVLKETQRFPTASQLEAYRTRTAAGRPDVLSEVEALRTAGTQLLSVAKGPGLLPTISANGNLPRLAGSRVSNNVGREHDAADFHADLRRRSHRSGRFTRTTRWCARPRSTWRTCSRTADQDTRTAYDEFQRERGAGRRAARGGDCLPRKIFPGAGG